MSNSLTPLNGQVGTQVLTIPSLTAIQEKDVLSGTGTLFRLQGNNNANAVSACYVKLYESASATVGTTDPSWVIRVPAGKTKTWIVGGGVGQAIATGLCLAATTTGGTAGTTSPSNAVPVKAHV